MEFNSSLIEEFEDIWVFCEQRHGQMMNTSFELISEGRKLADERGVKLVGVILGHNIEHLSQDIAGYGADKVILCDDEILKDYTTDCYSKVFCDLIMEKKPEQVLIGASHIGRDLAPRCAARLHTGLTADCTHLDIDMEKYIEFLKTSSSLDLSKSNFKMDDINLKMTRPAFGGHLMATIICPRFRPCISTVRPGVMKKGEYSQQRVKSCQIEKFPVKIEEKDIQTRVLEVVKETKQLVDLIGAQVIVSVGRGIGKDVEKGLELAKELADAFGGGVVAGSRVAIDSGWLSADHQVGQTGKTVHPKLYIALGISGAIQHKAGMQDSEFIVAVNKDEKAAIFDCADMGINGDLFKIVPIMIDSIKSLKKNK